MSVTRDEYVNKLKAKLDQWNAEIDLLEAKARRRQAEAKLSYDRQIDDLKDKRQAARERLEKLRGASGEAWEELKTGLESAAETLGDAIQSARAKFND